MRGVPSDPNGGARPTCYHCFRPLTHCVCGSCSALSAHCNILILQHPHERRKFYSTVKLVTRVLTNVKVLRGIIFEEHVIRQALAGTRPYLLYPGKSSVDCQSVAFDAQCTLVVIDGTWDEAGKIVFRNPILKTFPAVSFATTLQSKYHIRKQPREGCLSTLESIGHLLKQNALAFGDEAQAQSYDALFEVFDLMVQRQLSYFPRMRKRALEVL